MTLLNGLVLVTGDHAATIAAAGTGSPHAGRVHILGSLLDGDPAYEVNLAGSLGSDGAVVVDYNGWHDGDDWQSGAIVRIGSTDYDENTPAARIYEITGCRGDMNNDGLLSNFDIDPFVLALATPNDYAAAFPGLEGSADWHGNVNCDTEFDNFDIDPFIELVVAECCTSDCDPCESLAPPPTPTAEEMAAILQETVDFGRIQALIAIIDQALAGYEGDQYDYWSAVLAALQG